MRDPERRTVFTGTGSHIPARRVPNEDFLDHRFYLDYGAPCDPADNSRIIDKFREITAISERRWVDDGVVASDIATDAAAKAIASAGIDPETLDYLIVAHNFGDVRSDNRRTDLVPSLAARVKQGLAIANPARASRTTSLRLPGLAAGHPCRLLPALGRRRAGAGGGGRDAVPGVRPP
jgi:3-oxoacyl-[acyl-carrier-protein] synthase-3